MHKSLLILLLGLCALTSAEGPAWRDGLQDLGPAWESLLERNLESQTAHARLTAQKEALASAQATRWPRVDFSSSYQYTTEVASLDIALPAMIPGAQPTTLHKEMGDHDRSEVGILATYALFTGFAEKARVESAQWQTSARQESLRSLRAQLGLRLVTLHWQIQLTQNFLDFLRSQDSVLTDHVAHMCTLYDNGMVTQAEVLFAQAEQASQSAEEAQQIRRADSLYNEFQFLSGTDYPASLRQESEYLWRTPITATEEPQASQLPAARALTAQAQAVQSQEKSIAAESWPNVTIFAGWKAGNPGLAQASTDWMNYGVAGAQLQWNLFDGGARRSAQAQAVWESRALQSESERVANQQSTAWKQIAQEAQSLHVQHQALLAARDAAQKGLAIRQSLWNQGNAAAIDARDAKLQVLRIENQLRNTAIAGRILEARAHWLSGQDFSW